MKSLFARILFWFFLNTVILIALLFGFFNMRVGLDPDSPLRLLSGGGLRGAAPLIMRELSESPVEEWPDILKRYGEVYSITFRLVALNGQALDGNEEKLPPKVMDEVIALRESMPPPMAPVRPDERPPMPPQPSGQTPPHPQPPAVQPPQMKIPKPAGFWVRTTEPTFYWVGVGVRVMSGPERPPRSAALIAVSDSITGYGFFFDPAPWVILLATAVLVSALLWLPMARGITSSIGRITRATERIARGRFDIRLEEKRSDEIGQLGRAINDMAARLDGYVKGQKRFLGDVAHELASPIARMQLGLGILEQKLKGAHQEDLSDVMEEVEHMGALVAELLSFTRAEVSPGKVSLGPVDAAATAERAARREAGGAEVRFSIEPGLTVWADPDLIARAVANLIRNAVRYAKGSPIEIAGWREGETGVIEVRDEGPGVPEGMDQHLFEPFFRPEPSRERSTGGVGLGLSIVKTCVETCGGTVTCANRNPKGFAVSMRFDTSARASRRSGLKSDPNA